MIMIKLPALLPLFSACLLFACAPDTASSQIPLPVTTARPAPVETPATSPISPANSAQPTVYDIKVTATWPHDTSAFTQGLFFANSTLYESTGQRGQSQLRRLSLGNTTPSQTTPLPNEIFGEGATAVNGKIISISWQAGTGFIHDLKSFQKIGTFSYQGEGWGLTYDGQQLILSDGTDRLRFLDPTTFRQTGALNITLGGKKVFNINELEWVEGEIWANIWQEDVIIRINPKTGAITGLIDVSSLFPKTQRGEPYNDVPNGIAWDPQTKRLLLTGKRWPQIFEVTLKPRG